MPTALPTDPQELALWLRENLQDVERIAGTTQRSGTLPAMFDFAEVERHLESVSEKLKGVCNPRTRCIEFHPSLVGVYEDLQDMLSVAVNRYRVPDQFVICSPSFKHPDDSQAGLIPAEVAAYFDVVGLWRTLRQLADLPDSEGNDALFVANHTDRLTLYANYEMRHLSHVPGMTSFAADFNPSTIHADQKRSIIRATLIEAFKPRKEATLADVLERFETLDDEVRKSYAMYMAEFSVKKVMNEVERQNLDDTLSLNKTLSDIQNQLLALPAAILLAGATLRLDEPLRNYGVLAGVVVFCVLMWTLIGNQSNSINAIASHIGGRKEKVKSMPVEAGRDVIQLFDPLEKRVKRQRFTLRLIRCVVALVLVSCALVVLNINGDAQVSAGWAWLTSLLGHGGAQ